MKSKVDFHFIVELESNASFVEGRNFVSRAGETRLAGNRVRSLNYPSNREADETQDTTVIFYGKVVE